VAVSKVKSEFVVIVRHHNLLHEHFSRFFTNWLEILRQQEDFSLMVKFCRHFESNLFALWQYQDQDNLLQNGFFISAKLLQALLLLVRHLRVQN
jgi:hypothetical protein